METPSLVLPRHYTGPPDILTLVHYIVCTVGKRAVGIRLKCLLFYLNHTFREQKILLTSIAQDLYGDGVDCQDEYVEILDGDTVDALSLGK